MNLVFCTLSDSLFTASQSAILFNSELIKAGYPHEIFKHSWWDLHKNCTGMNPCLVIGATHELLKTQIGNTKTMLFYRKPTSVESDPKYNIQYYKTTNALQQFLVILEIFNLNFDWRPSVHNILNETKCLSWHLLFNNEPSRSVRFYDVTDISGPFLRIIATLHFQYTHYYLKGGFHPFIFIW